MSPKRTRTVLKLRVNRYLEVIDTYRYNIENNHLNGQREGGKKSFGKCWVCIVILSFIVNSTQYIPGFTRAKGEWLQHLLTPLAARIDPVFPNWFGQMFKKPKGQP